MARLDVSAIRRGAPLAILCVALLAGCASGPRGDGPGSNPPSDLGRVPDAEPRIETIRSGGPNKPYEVQGQSYVPITQDKAYTERGLASWYGRKFHGKRTASGEVYNMYAMTAAHPTLPIPSYARIRNPANGREVIVRVNDRGPFHTGRIVDLSYTAALKLDLLRGVAPVELTRITFDDIRTGAWRRDLAPPTPGDAPPVRTAATAPADATPAATGAVAVPAGSVVSVAATTTSSNSAGADSGPAGGNGSAGAAAANANRAGDAPAAAASSASAPSAPGPTLDGPQPMPTASVAAVADAPPARAYTVPARGYWVQLGAFRERGGAEAFQGRVATELDWLSPLLAVFGDASMYRLQAGPYPSRDEARAVAERVRGALQLVPVIVERR